MACLLPSARLLKNARAPGANHGVRLGAEEIGRHMGLRCSLPDRHCSDVRGLKMAGTVTVACKLPGGFRAEFDGKTVMFNGWHVGHDEGAKTAGFGLTPNVDADWYEGWVKSVGDFPAVINGVIFAQSASKAADEAKEKNKSVKSGFEQKTADDLGVQVVEK